MFPPFIYNAERQSMAAVITFCFVFVLCMYNAFKFLLLCLSSKMNVPYRDDYP